MTDDKTASLIAQKQAWLYSQVDVEFPTRESLRGRKLYQARAEELSYTQTELSELPPFSSDGSELYLVDFHRLTIMFSLMMSKHWQSDSDQSLIVEFLTQIILEPQYPIYIRFLNGEPQACALCHVDGDTLLISDVFVEDAGIREAFISQVAAELSTQHQGLIQLVTEDA